MILLEAVPLLLIFIAATLGKDSTAWNRTDLGLNPNLLLVRSWASSLGGSLSFSLASGIYFTGWSLVLSEIMGLKPVITPDTQ